MELSSADWVLQPANSFLVKTRLGWLLCAHDLYAILLLISFVVEGGGRRKEGERKEKQISKIYYPSAVFVIKSNNLSLSDGRNFF